MPVFGSAKCVELCAVFFPLTLPPYSTAQLPFPGTLTTQKAFFDDDKKVLLLSLPTYYIFIKVIMVIEF
jgi:hypothetical protein